MIVFEFYRAEWRELSVVFFLVNGDECGLLATCSSSPCFRLVFQSTIGVWCTSQQDIHWINGLVLCSCNPYMLLHLSVAPVSRVPLRRITLIDQAQVWLPVGGYCRLGDVLARSHW
ncbi:hypothetical protein BIW11_07101 [Tropilaelaps mercedesae]|uniref:Uncharacterized protein n=1 Tax=Tropilaelaps mercedesae TaxID=418985 RepID=A0A1V9XVI5_9ACAR|nr:hypothetical protein BIW11_07101 [Tropilaelaps mercedesae]